MVPGLDAYQIGRLTRVHQLNMEVTDGNRWVARSFGSDLLAHLTATMQQLLHGTKIPSLNSQSTDKLVYYAGHDISKKRERVACAVLYSPLLLAQSCQALTAMLAWRRHLLYSRAAWSLVVN